VESDTTSTKFIEANRIVIKTGEIRAIMFGLIANKERSILTKYLSLLNGLNAGNLTTSEPFVCLALTFIELFIYSNVSLASCGKSKGMGLFASASYSATLDNGEGQRMCIGLSLKSSNINTLDDNHIARVVKSKVIHSNLKSNRKKVITYSKYIKHKDNRGLYGVVYASNSCVGSGPEDDSLETEPNCVCFSPPDATEVNSMVLVDGVFNKYVKISKISSKALPFTVFIVVLSLLSDVVKGTELCWNYPWDRTDYSDPTKPNRKFKSVTQLEVSESFSDC
jgi:hypothetical protein